MLTQNARSKKEKGRKKKKEPQFTFLPPTLATE